MERKPINGHVVPPLKMGRGKHASKLTSQSNEHGWGLRWSTVPPLIHRGKYTVKEDLPLKWKESQLTDIFPLVDGWEALLPAPKLE